MTEEIRPPEDPKTLVNLKLAEPNISSEEPWRDDLLERAQIAAKLTSLIAGHSSPLVLSIHGHWGTGKTFMLKRWQKALEKEGYSAIYFNAWEDDFCDDPLLSILGQLSEYFRDPKLAGIVKHAAELAIPLVQFGLSTASALTTGIPLPSVPIADQNSAKDDPLENYLHQRETKDRVKQRLADLSAAVADKTGQPLIFIIDELDRCRPTFAVELLERVKHMFDLPNMVFALGINRDELCSSLKSLYGEINPDVYLRRFFDLEFTLPEVDSEPFARDLMKRFELDQLFVSVRRESGLEVHMNDLRQLPQWFPLLWSAVALSLRDIDYCVRLIKVIGKGMELDQRLNPWGLGVLITLKVKNLNLYRRFIRGYCRPGEVMDYLDEVLHTQESDVRLSTILDRIEAFLYVAEHQGDYPRSGEAGALADLRHLKDNTTLSQPSGSLSKRTNRDLRRARKLVSICESQEFSWLMTEIPTLVGLIDLHQDLMRR